MFHSKSNLGVVTKASSLSSFYYIRTVSVFHFTCSFLVLSSLRNKIVENNNILSPPLTTSTNSRSCSHSHSHKHSTFIVSKQKIKHHHEHEHEHDNNYEHPRPHLHHSLNNFPLRHVSSQLHPLNHPQRRRSHHKTTIFLHLNTMPVRPASSPPCPIRLPPPHRLFHPSIKLLHNMLGLFPILHQPIRTNLQHSFFLWLPN